MTLTIDLSGMHARIAVATASLREEQPAMMKQILDDAAADERSTHAYQNRTGDAEASTQAGPIQRNGTYVWCDMGIDVPYAVYLEARGLTNIEEKAAAAEAEISRYFAVERDRISGL